LREARLKKEMRAIGQRRCDPSLDEPEPRLAILGPPAVTRRMFELWRADQRLQARFDLRNPLHRRDYLVWLSEEGRSVGLDEASIAAAVAIMRRGTSLVCAPPRWPSQAKRAIVPPNETVDAWLAEPIPWELEAQPRGIPMPRVLALLWELRQDVRLHFPNRTPADVRNFLGWCLTQGVRDQCVPVDLTEPGLAAFLDTPDPELGGLAVADYLPVTRLMRIVAPLYDGPYPEIARQFPHTRRACFCIGIWVCGVLRRRFGWPESFVRQPLQWLSSTAPAASDAFVTLNNLVLGLWEIYPNLQARCHLGTHEGRSALLEWFLAEGVREVELDDICAVASVQALTHPTPKAGSPGSQSGGRRVRVPPVPGVRFAPLAGEPAIKRDLCLIGYADLVSGRAEDLRMSALALQRQRRTWAMLDRLSGKIATERGEAAAALAEPPAINLVHLNADTALFDYLFLRERGIERAYTIGYWAWELAKFPEEWASSFAFVNEVWAASRFAYEAIAPAATKPVFLMPMAVALPPAEAGLKRADFGLPEDKFVFYFSFDFRSFASRKNPLAAVETFRRAFPRRDAPAVLLLKSIGSEWKPEERDNLLEAIRGDPRILLIDCELTRPRATALLALADCFLSLHRSEGFGRGPAEAMLLGKPVIATNYSGTADFATPETALLVDYELVPVGEGEYPGATGQVWAEADIEQAAAAMRRISRDPAVARKLCRAGCELVSRRYQPQVVGRRYIERIAAITKDCG